MYNTKIAFVYLDGSEVYVHEAVVRPAEVEDGRYGEHCAVECGTPLLLGMPIVVTGVGPEPEPEWKAHLGCALATGGHLMTLEDGLAMQEQNSKHAAA